MRKEERRLRALAVSEGLTVVKVKCTRHYHVHVEAQDGRRGVIMAAATPSDYRAEINQRARMRRFAMNRSATKH